MYIRWMLGMELCRTSGKKNGIGLHISSVILLIAKTLLPTKTVPKYDVFELKIETWIQIADYVSTMFN